MNCVSSNFPLAHSWLLVSGLILAVIAFILHFRNKYTAAIIFLILSAFAIRMFMILLDPFLHLWDECFHALVAKNMMHHPFQPMLRASNLFSPDINNWCNNHIWLHKPPLFLWQMALSMKIFGISELSFRLPGAFMGSIGVYCLYRLSFLVTNNLTIAFIAASMACFSYYNLELTSGLFGMDMNDTAFDFYSLASIWAFAEYMNNKTIKWATVAGVLAGCAVLTKWLAGMIVYSGWGIILILEIRKDNFKLLFYYFLLSFGICLTSYIAWLLYTLSAFHAEAMHELQYNFLHVNNVIEGHDGDALFYYRRFYLYFGEYVYYLIPVGLLFIFTKKLASQPLTIAVLVCFFFPFLFFSVVAKTKIDPFFMQFAPIGYLIIAIGIYHLAHLFRHANFILIPAVIYIVFQNFALADITRLHDPRNAYTNNWVIHEYNARISKSLPKFLPPGVTIVMNAEHPVDIMFYNNLDAYNGIFTKEQFELIKKNEMKVDCFFKNNEKLPDFMSSYKYIYLLPDSLNYKPEITTPPK